jgi:hypothetical protein
MSSVSNRHCREVIAGADPLEHLVSDSICNDASIRDGHWHKAWCATGECFVGTGAYGPWPVSRIGVRGNPPKVSKAWPRKLGASGSRPCSMPRRAECRIPGSTKCRTKAFAAGTHFSTRLRRRRNPWSSLPMGAKPLIFSDPSPGRRGSVFVEVDLSKETT